MRVKSLIKRALRLVESRQKLAARMRDDWNKRAHDNARHYVATCQETWSDEEFFHSGRIWLEQYVIPSLRQIVGNRSSSDMRMIEIGCGAGRMTRGFSELFGSVDAIDVSPEMITQARAALGDRTNVRFSVTNGTDLSGFGNGEFDFAFSGLVFQHIPRKAVVLNYIKEASRVLRPGSVFLFQLNGVAAEEDYADTWEGVGFSEKDVRRIAHQSGFIIHASSGGGTQYYWLTFIKTGAVGQFVSR